MNVDWPTEKERRVVLEESAWGVVDFYVETAYNPEPNVTRLRLSLSAPFLGDRHFKLQHRHPQ